MLSLLPTAIRKIKCFYSTYIFAALTSETAYVTKGDIFFLPDSNSVKDIPFPPIYYGRVCFFQFNDGLVIYTDSPYMLLGSLYDEKYAKSDLSAIPGDGTAKYVEVTLTDLNLDANDQIGSRYNATIMECD